jgi:glycosyltransferase involved in cell wall biosynthesis
MNKNGKTLVVLSPGFPANEADTTCLPSQQLFIKSLNQNFPSLNIIILCFQYPHFSSVYQWNNNKIIAFGGRNRGKIYKLLTWLRVWKTLNQLKRKNEITGLLSFWCGECALAGKWFGKRNGIKHYAWILGQDAKKNNRYIKWIRPGPDELIAMSDFLADEFFKNYFMRPAHIVPNGIEINLSSKKIAKKDIDIAGAGSLIPLKRYDIFISVIKKITDKITVVHAVLCGKGSEENNLRLLIEGFNIQDNISLAGELQHKDVLEIMQRSKIFLHPSSYEGFSSACLEALSAGAHVISFFRPMNEQISHWHIARTEEEMISKALEILQDHQASYEPVSPYIMSDTAKKMMLLFGYE